MDLSDVGAQGLLESEDYYLDLGVDTNVDDFDFKLDGGYGDEMQPHEEGTDKEQPTDATNNPEIGYEDEEVQPGTLENSHMDEDAVDSDPSKDVENNVNQDSEDDAGEDVGMEYRDEIGYEEEESAAAGIGDNQETTVPESADLGISVDFTENQEAYEQVEDFGAHGNIIGNEYSVFEESSGEDVSHAEFEDVQDVAGSHDGKPSVADEDNDTSAHHSQEEHENSASRLNNSQDPPAEHSPFAPIPDLLVSYNNGQYYLVGDPEDDPDSYFLSDERDLDEPLSHFLASIRSVIRDEVSPEDELMIRINTMGLEFGERSNQKFLTRSFRDILSCFAALASDLSKDASQNPGSLQIELLVRRDSEARFLELLEETGMRSSAQQSGFPDDSEDPESASVSDVAYAEGDEEYDEELGGEYAEEYQLNGEDAPASVSEVQDTGEEERYVEYETEEVERVATGGGNAVIRGVLETEGHLGGLDAAPLTQHYSADAEGQHGDEVEYDEGQEGEQWGEMEADGQAGIGGGSTVDAAEAIESSANDVDASLRHHDLPNGEELTNDSTEATFAIQEVNPNLDVESLTGGTKQIDADPAETLDSKSKQTSRTSTINGDDVDPTQLAEGDFPTVDEARPQGEKVGKDEIDWENEVDEPEQTAATPPSASASGKRGRVNDAEALEDETDHKRRRT